ncbi:Fe(3+) ABC transporter substrate-binding protein [Lentibacillus saliphilus]|uniref:Fe(3+) ABC transporter substrate-binding protein n=1 Tax=Lentibacillus saliphilus TaxID=2737028 RepID=UPI001C310E8F|nr:Fe(3+) ABC transporter substrate-binding protein [Lentibacillus saliphilus]
MKKQYVLFSIIAMMLLVLAACGGNNNEESQNNTDGSNTTGDDQGEINLYTGRHYETDQALYDQFTDETGIKVNVIKGKDDELIARLEREGKASKADLLITADAGRLYRAKTQELLQPVESDTLTNNIPEKYRDPENEWFGLTKRARIIAYHKERVNPDDIQSYEDLTKDAFQDKVLIRSSSNIYNQSLLASLIALNGEPDAKTWAEGVVDNMARDPKGGDRDQAIAVAAGEGDVAVMNTYYLGKMLNAEDEEQVKAAEQLGVIFPNQDSTGTHVNISGIGLTTSSPNKDNAILFMEFLTKEQAQEQFAKANYEYPVNPNVAVADLLESWGSFKEQDLNLSKLGEFNNEAIMIMNEIGWK